MNIAQFIEKNSTCLGYIENDLLTPIDFTGDMLDFISGDHKAKASGNKIPIDTVSFAPAVSRPSKIIAIGLNYADHISESKGQRPDNPMVFAKFTNSLIGHNKDITWDPNLTAKVDFEAELAVVIGRETYKCPEKEVKDVIFGYTCANDVSARDLQFGDKQWVRGKSLDTFCPLGPWIVTKDEIPAPNSLAISCRLNGELMQESNTGHMIFKIPELVSFLSHQFTLFPGDVILTGTPDGVGTFREPSVYMKEGDEVIVEIEGIGRLVNRCAYK